MPTRRQLAAIMFTDIEGYTSLMQRDEAAAVEMRNTHRSLFESITHKYHGKILQYYGDGTLSIFDSAIDAVQSGIDLQRSFIEASIPVRIGIHLGDIIFDKDDIIGDGVNIASRIESLGKAGSVLISGKVYDEVKNKQDIATHILGNFKLKNVETITPVYALTNYGLVIPENVGEASKGAPVRGGSFRAVTKYWWIGVVAILLASTFYLVNSSGESLEEDDKSIAVLPFINMSPDPEQEYFSDGITEDILSHLSTIKDLKVISRTTSWGYKGSSKGIPEIGRELDVDHILEGSVRRSGDNIRVVAQLIDVNTDEHILSQTYDRKITEIFDIQTEIASEIANLLRTKLAPRALGSAGNPEITAYDYYLKGHNILEDWSTQQDLENTIVLLRQAIKEEQDYAEAYADLAEAYFHKHYNWVNKSKWLDSSVVFVNTAIKLNPRLPTAYLTRAQIYGDILNESAKAKRDLFKALDLDPNNSDALLNVGLYHFENEDFEKGVELVMKSIEVNPDQTDPKIFQVWGTIYEFIDSIDKAAQYYQQAIRLKPDGVEVLDNLTQLLTDNQRYQEAIGYAERIAKLDGTLIAYDNLAWAYFRNGDLQKAKASWAKMETLEGDYDPDVRIPYRHRIAYISWLLGNRHEAEQFFQSEVLRLEEVIASGQETEFRAEYYDLAGVKAFLGYKEEAIKWLFKAVDDGFFSAGLMAEDPLFDSIREVPEYLELLRADQEAEAKERRRLDPGRKVVRDKIRNLKVKGMPSL